MNEHSPVNQIANVELLILKSTLNTNILIKFYITCLSINLLFYSFVPTEKG